MIILAVDTTNNPCGVAIAKDGELLYESVSCAGRQHAAQLMPMIDAALKSVSLTAANVELWACATGPGSFTGVRIGVSTIRGLAFATGAPCAAVNALESLALPVTGALAVPAFDARRGQIYVAAFADGRRVLPDTAIEARAFQPVMMEAARSLGLPVVLLGEGARVNAEALLGACAALASPLHMQTRPFSVALLAQKAAPVAYDGLLPYYLRPSQAEQDRARKRDDA